MVADRNISVLIVDDSLIIRRLMTRFLTQMGVKKVVEAQSARMALEKLNEESIDLIISDWSMPGTSGLSFLKTVRDSKKFEKIPFIMLTAEGLKSSIEKAFEAGVSKYVLKPFNYDTIKKEIDSIFPNK